MEVRKDRRGHKKWPQIEELDNWEFSTAVFLFQTNIIPNDQIRLNSVQSPQLQSCFDNEKD